MKRILLLLAVLSCGPMTAFAQNAAACSEVDLEDSARQWFMEQSGATYCSEDAIKSRWACYGDAGRTWTVKRTLRDPGVHTWRSVEPSQGDVWAFDCEWDESAEPCSVVVCGAE